MRFIGFPESLKPYGVSSINGAARESRLDTFSCYVQHRWTCFNSQPRVWLAESPIRNWLRSQFRKWQGLGTDRWTEFGPEADFLTASLRRTTSRASPDAQLSSRPISNAMCRPSVRGFQQKHCAAIGKCLPTIRGKCSMRWSWRNPA